MEDTTVRVKKGSLRALEVEVWLFAALALAAVSIGLIEGISAPRALALTAGFATSLLLLLPVLRVRAEVNADSVHPTQWVLGVAAALGVGLLVFALRELLSGKGL